MRFRRDIDRVMERVEAFTEGKIRALIHITGIEGFKGRPIPPLEDWDLPRDFRKLLDAQFANFTSHWEQRAGIEDDLIPAIYPYYGIAEHSAFVGGEVKFGGNTSYHLPLIADYERDFEKLKLDEDNPWFRLVIDGMDYLRQKTEGMCLIKLRGAESPLDIANAARGNDIFLDFYEDEEWAHRLLTFCTDAMKFMATAQMGAAGSFRDGYISGFGVWMPGHSFGHLSEDASCLCSLKQYLTFGKPYTEAALAKMDSALMHTHTVGRHALPGICEIEKLRYIDITRDPNQPAPVDVLREYTDVLRHKSVLLPLTMDEMKQNLELLREHRLVISYQARDIEDAKAAVSFVRGQL